MRVILLGGDRLYDLTIMTIPKFYNMQVLYAICKIDMQ